MIGLDAHVLGTRAGGNETYMRGLLEALQAHAPETPLIAFTGKAPHGLPPDFPFPLARIPVSSSYLRVPFALPWLAHKYGVDVLHVQYTAPPYCPCRYVVSMHDIVALRFPEWMPFLDRHRLRLFTRSTLDRAARVFVLTKALRDEISDTLAIPQDRFDVVQPALDPLFRCIEDQDRIDAVLAGYGIERPYLLYVGLLQPRKNLHRLARAFAALQENGFDHRLVIVGKRAWLHEEMLREIEDLNLGKRICFTDYVARYDLPALYSGADVFAYPSLYEGFGIPVLEAMACGTPVLSSMDPALREVTGDNAVHVDAYDTDAIGAGMISLLSDAGLRERLRTAGPRQASGFTLEKMASAAIEGYKKALQ